MNFLIYGAGALGQALGTMLSAAGHKVDLVLRSRFIPTLERKGLQVDGVLGAFTVPPGKLGLYDNIEKTGSSYDYVLLTTKSYDTETAVDDLAGIKERIEHVVSMQNGCGNLESVAAAFGEEKTLGARVITGFEIKTPGRVHVSVIADAIHVGGCREGEIPASAEHLARAVKEAGHPCVTVADINSSLHAKLLYNCALNPLGALLQVPYGALAENSETRKVIDRVIEETFAVIKAMGGNTPWDSLEEYKELFYSSLVPATATHRASMLQDLENQKPTEIDALTGYVSRRGMRLAIATPTCDTLTAMVRFKEALFLKH